jgi:hypothetical protein
MIITSSFIEFHIFSLSLTPMPNFLATFWPLSKSGNFGLIILKADAKDKKVNIAVT